MGGWQDRGLKNRKRVVILKETVVIVYLDSSKVSQWSLYLRMLDRVL